MDEKLARILGLPSEAEKAAQHEQFETKLKELFLGTQPDTSAADLLRNIVESDWFVPARADAPSDTPFTADLLAPITVPPGKHRLAISSDQQTKKSKEKDGKGGCVLPLFLSPPEQPHLQINARRLVRALPGNISALLLHLPDQAPTELGSEYFPELLSLADAVDMEDVLLHPAANQIEMLRSFAWLAEFENDALRVETVEDRQLVHAYTHCDRIGWTNREVRTIEGEELFRQLAENCTIDGVVVNRYRVLKLRGESLFAPVLSPSFARHLLDGRDTRPGAAPLPARNVHEIEIWLQLRGFPLDGVKYIDAPYADGPLVRAKAPQATTWRMQETLLSNSVNNDDCTWSPVFVLPPLDALKANSGSESEIAPNATRILCAGLMAKALYAHLSDAKDPTRAWCPGRNFIVGRFIPEWAREHSRHRRLLANELLKLIPPDGESIPRSAVFTVEGAALLRSNPHATQRSWLEATARQAERYSRAWVWWG